MTKIVRQILLSAILLVLCSVSAFADSIPDPKALYLRGEYSKAAEAYLQIEKTQGSSASLYFDLANCYVETGDYAHAMLYYSRARRLAPRDREIKNNINYLASKIEDTNRAELHGKKISVVPDSETFFQTADRMIAEDVLSNTWATWSAITFILFLICLTIYLFCSDVLLRKTGFFGGISLFIVSVVFIIFAFMAASSSDSRDRGVLMAYKTELLIEPSSDAKPASSQLCQGTCLDIIAEETDVQGATTWYKVRLNSNFEGWIRAADIEII